MLIFHSYVNVYQRVCLGHPPKNMKNMETPWTMPGYDLHLGASVCPNPHRQQLPALDCRSGYKWSRSSPKDLVSFTRRFSSHAPQSLPWLVFLAPEQGSGASFEWGIPMFPKRRFKETSSWGDWSASAPAAISFVIFSLEKAMRKKHRSRHWNVGNRTPTKVGYLWSFIKCIEVWKRHK